VLKNTSTKDNKYVVNQKHEHVDDICFSSDQHVRNISKLLISVDNDRRNEIGRNSHASLCLHLYLADSKTILHISFCFSPPSSYNLFLFSMVKAGVWKY